MIDKSEFKIGDICYVVEDDEASYGDREKYLNCLGKVLIVENPVKLLFPDDVWHAYHPWELRLATVEEHDRYYLERYKYV